VNGRPVEVRGEPLSYVVIERTWTDGDVVRLRLPMSVAVRKWPKNHDSVSVDYGPLTFSLEIGQRWSRYGGTEAWPEQEVFPTTPWNYGLLLDEKDPAASFEIQRGAEPLGKQPFAPESAPIRLRAKAGRIPGWRQDKNGLIGVLQASPARSNQPVESISLIPMGCARLRIAAFPTIGDGPDAHDWGLPPSASHCFASDTLDELDNGIPPKKSSDSSIPRFTWWDHKGTHEWVQYDFVEPRTLTRADVYWFDDSGQGACRVPMSWRLMVKEDGQWKPVHSAGSYGVERDQFNHVQFDAIKTASIRLEAELQSGFSAGILRWKVE
jgi:F5/8 type C domain-containing protein